MVKSCSLNIYTPWHNHRPGDIQHLRGEKRHAMCTATSKCVDYFNYFHRVESIMSMHHKGKIFPKSNIWRCFITMAMLCGLDLKATGSWKQHYDNASYYLYYLIFKVLTNSIFVGRQVMVKTLLKWLQWKWKFYGSWVKSPINRMIDSKWQFFGWKKKHTSSWMYPPSPPQMHLVPLEKFRDNTFQNLFLDSMNTPTNN